MAMNIMLQASTTTEPPLPSLTPTPRRMTRKDSFSSFSNSESDEEGYYNSLQRYSTLYRILLGKPYTTETKLGHWNRIDLKLVNELGLTLTSEQKYKCWLEVDCRLLIETNGQYKTCKNFSISCRPLQHDNWEFNTTSGITGFYYNTDGDFEYIITIDNNEPNPKNITTHQLYIQIYPTCKPQQMIQAFPLVIGPIAIIQQQQQTLMINDHNQHQYNKSSSLSRKKERNSHVVVDDWIEKGEKVCQDIYHACCIQNNTFLVIKEEWELGTPGKMWDSALVLSQMFSDKIKSNPARFRGHRILDLSAGTGCVGLLIALLYKNVYNQDRNNLPHITMTDLPEALHLIHQNQALNDLKDYATIQSLIWGEYNDVQRILQDGSIHTIIASDVLYEPASFSKLVQTLDWLSESGQEIDIYLGYKRRGLSGEDEQSFFGICAEKFDISILSNGVDNDDAVDEGWIVGKFHSNIFKETGVNIYQLVRKRNLLSDI